MARKKDKFEEFSRCLITSITGFQDDDENFDLCQQFALSNFRFHRFLDVDSHKVNRTIQGVHEKLLIHSQQEKADLFKKLIDRFLDAPIFEDRCTGKTDTHYAVLSLLLHVADSPTQSECTERQAQILSECEDDFDWAAYLNEGEDEICRIYPESPDELSEGDEEFEVKPEDSVLAAGDHGHISVRDGPSVMAVDPIADPDDWLARNVIVQYWKGAITLANASFYSTSNLAIDWEHYLTTINPCHSVFSKTVLTEYHIVREILWMLSGAKDLFIYDIVDSHFAVKENLILSHLTGSSLHNLLTILASYGDIVQRLQTFITDNATSRDSCQTYQAFAAALSDYLKMFKDVLTGIEKTTIEQSEPVSLSFLLQRLSDRLKELDALQVVFQLGIEECEDGWGTSRKACHLLSVMYDILLEWDDFSTNQQMVSLLLPLWIQTSRPYLDIADEWITHGNLLDPYKEFVIQKNAGVQSLDETFWESAFTLHLTKQSTDSTVEQLSKEQYFTTSWAPRFLQPVLDKIILAGKSMEMLMSLGRLSEVVDSKTMPLYSKLLHSLLTCLGSSHQTANPAQPTTHDQPVTVFTESVQHQMKLKGIRDLLLDLNFKAILNLRCFQAEPLLDEKDELHVLLGQLTTESLVPIRVLLKDCLYPHITERYQAVCTHLLRLLKTEYSLLQHMATMRSIFLMESGDTMYDFYRDLFEKLRFHEPWQDMSSLNVSLQEALYEHHQHLISSLVVGVETAVSQERIKSPITALSGLSLHYKVPWPIDTVINSRCQKAYNEIFTFLLQIKRAKYCLDELCFCDLETKGVTKHSVIDTSAANTPLAAAHRIQLFRMRLLHFVNSLHNYIMTRILHSTGLEFQSELESATDLDQVITVHSAYVSKIHERCLLHKKVAFVKEAVLKVLNLSPTFQTLWDSGLDQISMESVSEMEAEFNRCLKFLSSFLNNVIKRGSFPHLEVLAFSLLTSADYTSKPT